MSVGRFALGVAKKCIEWCNNYFGIDFPLKKCDLIAIDRFYAYAMENWGLIMFREEAILYDPEKTSSETKDNIALLIGHEVSHMWFGDLATMHWWSDIWLKEGVADFIMYLSIGELYPELQTWHHYQSDVLLQSMKMDALNSSHPIEIEVRNLREISQIFNAIIYKKGAAIIHMLYTHIGAEDFQNGLRQYLNKFQYGNATTVDFWKSFETTSDQKLSQLMSCWTSQKGFPVIEVTQRQLEENRSLLTFRQRKFTTGFSADEDFQCLWSVPITLCTSKEPESKKTVLVLHDRSCEVIVEKIQATDWVKVNAKAVGFYHVLYESSHLQEFVPAIRSKSMSPLDRWNLQNDLLALVQAGHASTIDMLQLMKSFVDEDDYAVWSSVDSALHNLHLLLTNTNNECLLHTYGRELYENIFAEVGWDASPEEPHARSLLRTMIIERLAEFGDEHIRTEAIKRFESHIRGSNLIAADLRSTIYKIVVSTREKDYFEAVLKIFRSSDMQDEKHCVASALGCVSSEERMQQMLKFALSSEMNSLDPRKILCSMANTIKGRNAAWTYFKNNAMLFRVRFKRLASVGTLIKAVFENFATEEKALEIEQFFEANPFPAAEVSIKQTVENIRSRAKWSERDLNSIKQFLS